MVAYIYLIQVHINEKYMYKIGMCTQEPCHSIKRLKSYPKDSNICLVLQIPQSNVAEHEAKFIRALKNKFPLAQGKEYFFGEHDDVINECIDVYVSIRSEKDFKSDNYALPSKAVQDLKSVKLEAKQRMFVKDYQDLKRLTSLVADELNSKVISGKASTSENLRCQAYNFNRFVIRKSRLLKMSEDKLKEMMDTSEDSFEETDKYSLNECIETKLFNLSYLRRDIRMFLGNVMQEFQCDNIERVIFCNQNSVKSIQKSIMKLESIKHLCQVLKIKCSVDIETKVKEEDVLAYYQYYKNLKHVFDENFSIGPLHAKEEILQAKQLIKIMLKSWNGCSFERKMVSHRGPRQDRKREYEYTLSRSKELALAIFYQCILENIKNPVVVEPVDHGLDMLD